MNNFKLHAGDYFGREYTPRDCAVNSDLGHGPFLFVRNRKDLGEEYIECICLRCGCYDVYNMKDIDIFSIIYTHDNNLQSILEELPKIREYLINDPSKPLNDKVEELNTMYSNKTISNNKKLMRVK